MELFSQSKFKECISYIEDIDVNQSYEAHQILQMYRGLSLFAFCQIKDAFHCFESIFNERKTIKGEQVNEMDVVIRAQFQLETLFYCTQKAEQLNDELLHVTQEYQKQHQHDQFYDECIFLFGMGTYLFIETSREEVSPLAYEYLETAFNKCKKYQLEILKVLSWAYSYCDDKKKSDEWCKKLYEMKPLYPSAAGIYGVYLLNENQLDLAEKIVLECVEQCDYDPVSLFNVSNLYRKQEKEDKEQEYIEKMFALTPKNSFIYCKYGSYLMRKDQLALGLSYLKMAILIDPNDFDSYQELINYETNENQNNELEAVKYCHKCLEIYPTDGYTYYRLSQIYYNRSFIIEAEPYLQNSIRLKNYIHLKNLSEFQLGYIAEARLLFKEALKYNFKCCGYKKLSRHRLKNCIVRVHRVCSKMKNVNDIIHVIDNLEGRVVERFQEFANGQGVTENLKALYLLKLDNLRTHFTICLYQKHIESHLTFKSKTQFWDLYLE